MKKKPRIRRVKTEGRQLAMPEGLPGVRGQASWHVVKSLPGETPSTINYMGGDARMALPDDDGAMDKLTIIHEMLHAAHSPIEPPQEIPRDNGDKNIGVQAVAIAEEIRINTMMRYNMGKQWTSENMDSPGIREVIRFKAKHPSPETMEFLLIQHLCAWPLMKHDMEAQWSEVLEVLSELIDALDTRPDLKEYYKLTLQWISAVTHKVRYIGLDSQAQKTFQRGGIPSWKEFTIPVADYLDHVFSSIDQAHAAAKSGAAEENKPSGQEDLDSILRPYQKKKSGRQMNDLAEDPTGVPNPVEFMKVSDYPPEWGDLTIYEPPLPHRLAGKHLQKSKYHATDMGVIPRNIHRGIIDGQVFAVKRRIPGGSVLIDDSGSMSWLPEQIEAVMVAAPAVIIATYSGSRDKGELRVVAKNKRRADKETIKSKYGGNDVDMPALRWLADQSKPRIWVTDGGVHPGRGGDPLLAAEECVNFCLDNDINVVPNAKEAHAVFTGDRELYR